MLAVDRYIVYAIVRDLDPDGDVLSEKKSEPAVVFGETGLAKWAADLRRDVDKINEPKPQPASPRVSRNKKDESAL